MHVSLINPRILLHSGSVNKIVVDGFVMEEHLHPCALHLTTLYFHTPRLHGVPHHDFANGSLISGPCNSTTFSPFSKVHYISQRAQNPGIVWVTVIPVVISVTIVVNCGVMAVRGSGRGGNIVGKAGQGARARRLIFHAEERETAMGEHNVEDGIVEEGLHHGRPAPLLALDETQAR